MTKKAKTKKKATGKPFKKGNAAAKGYGRPKMTDEQKALALTTRTQFKMLLSQYSALTFAEVKKHLKEKKLPAIDMAVLKHMEQMIDAGSMDRVDWTANHIMGKPKEISHVKVEGGLQNTIDLKKLSKEDLIAYKALVEKSKA